MGLIGLEQFELFALELEKCHIDLVYSLASRIINHWAQHLVKIYMTIRSRLSPIMGLIGQEHLELFTFESEKLLHLSLFAL